MEAIVRNSYLPALPLLVPSPWRLMTKTSSPAANPVAEATVRVVPPVAEPNDETVVTMPSALVERSDPRTAVLMFFEIEMVTEPSEPVPVPVAWAVAGNSTVVGSSRRPARARTRTEGFFIPLTGGARTVPEIDFQEK